MSLRDEFRQNEYTPSALLEAVLTVTARQLGLSRASVAPETRIVADLGATMDQLLQLISAIGDNWDVDLARSQNLGGASRLEDITVRDIYTELRSFLEEGGAVPHPDEAVSRTDLVMEDGLGELLYVKPTLTESHIVKRAKKLRRPRSFWETCVATPQPVGAIMLLSFPITYPLYSLLSKPRALKNLVLVLWPFYFVEVGLLMRTLQTIDVCVEGITNGLGSIFRTSDGSTTYEPYVAVPGGDLGLKHKPRRADIPSTQLVDMVRIRHALGEDEVTDYLSSGAADVARGATTRAGIRFKHGLELSNDDVGNVVEFEVSDVRPFYYPLYVATYVRKNVVECLSLAAVKGSVFDLENLTQPVMTNPALLTLGEAQRNGGEPEEGT